MQNLITNNKKLILGLIFALVAVFSFSGFAVHPALACNSGCPAPTPDIAATCYSDPTTVAVNDPVTWTAAATGGNGSFTYSWTGTDGLTATDKSFTVSYDTPGIKSAVVSVTSGNLTVNRTCTVNVTGQSQNPLSVSCVANPQNGNINDTITYTSTATGGNGSYFYSWTGTDGLYGQSQTVSKQYGTSGTKSAIVTVTSNGQSQTATCTSYIQQQNNQNLYANCYATPNYANVNQNITWYVNATGGNGNYTYTWSGTDGLYGYGQSIYRSYSYSGLKTASVTVYSNGQTYVANCSVNINQISNITITQNPTGNLSSGVYLSQVPYTGAGLNLKISLFVLGLFFWSLFAAYMIIARNRKNAFATPTGSISMKDRIAEFKKANSIRKGN